MENSLIFKSFVKGITTVQKITFSVTSSIKSTTKMYLHLIDTKRLNRELREENSHLKIKLAVFNEIKQENRRLKKKLEFTEHSDFQMVVSKVVGRDLISKYQLITINKGKIHGIKKYMMVINEQGFVGLIFRTFSRTSQILLLTDPMASIQAVVARSRVHGIVEGTGAGLLTLQYLNHLADVKAGDIVLSSSQEDLSIPSYPIGTVVKAKENPGQMIKEVSVEPFINTTKLEEIFIITNPAIPSHNL